MINSHTDNPYTGKFKSEHDGFHDQTMDAVHHYFRTHQGEPGIPDNETSEEFEIWLDENLGKAICAYFAALFPNSEVVYTGHGYEIIFNNDEFTPVD